MFNLSREKAQESIKAGLVNLNYEVVSRQDGRVEDGDVISLRGHGKYRLVINGETSHKGKIKICAMKYI